jgi:hypothetical protein
LVGLLGLPHPLLWGVAAFLLHYIPFVEERVSFPNSSKSGPVLPLALQSGRRMHPNQVSGRTLSIEYEDSPKSLL